MFWGILRERYKAGFYEQDDEFQEFVSLLFNGILSLDFGVEVSQSMDSIVVLLNFFEYNIGIPKDKCDERNGRYE